MCILSIAVPSFLLFIFFNNNFFCVYCKMFFTSSCTLNSAYNRFFFFILYVIEDKRESCQSTWNTYWFFSLNRCCCCRLLACWFGLFLKFSLYVCTWISFVIILISIVFFSLLSSTFSPLALWFFFLLLLLFDDLVWLYFGAFLHFISLSLGRIANIWRSTNGFLLIESDRCRSVYACVHVFVLFVYVSGNIDCKQIRFLSIQWMSAKSTCTYGIFFFFFILLIVKLTRGFFNGNSIRFFSSRFSCSFKSSSWISIFFLS